VLLLEGELDMAQAPKLAAALDACTDGLPVLVDLRNVWLLDSAGIHVLLGAREVGRPAVLVCTPGGPASRVLEMVEATGQMPFYEDVATAVEALGLAPSL
jgi:anti-anti-sigma factor